ncbi:MAG: trypsin-like peptidase domain-containing protein [Bacteroidia bacterium]|nr:trypsin-like peptidase domain-containing protein [Bacteroidia bacterium]
MNTGNVKNMMVIVVVAILSSVITLFGYNAISKNNSNKLLGSSASVEQSEYANTFDQSKNVRLASLTTSQGYPDFTEAASQSVNGVVHVKVKSISQQQYMSPFDFFFGFGNRTPQPREQIGFGSGVIISKDGYIITNNHVVEGATEVSVTLNDNREFTAKVVGTDSQTDIALLKIEGSDFPYLTFGNSDALQVGEWVLAVGNPFNLTSTVTAGIVSAKNRGDIVGGGNLGIQSFIQVDAAVNRGNSGGALVNTRGELVGINTAIFSQSGDFSGLAFAVPISIAGKVAADIKQYGAVQRAYLGISVMPIEVARREDPERAKELSQIVGVVIDDFGDRSASKAAGLEKGDIIKAINNVQIRNFAGLQDQLSRYRPGDKVKVTVDRNGKELSYTVELQNDAGTTEVQRGSDSMDLLGATFNEIPNSRKQQLGINSGVEVAGVENNGLFRKEGINKGFIIMRVNNAPVNSGDDISKIVSAVSAGSQDKVILIAGFYPNGRTQYIAIDLSQGTR